MNTSLRPRLQVSNLARRAHPHPQVDTFPKHITPTSRTTYLFPRSVNLPGRASGARTTPPGSGNTRYEGSTQEDSLLVLPVFMSNNILLPTATGVLRAFEPHYVQMFEELSEKLQEMNGAGARFLHILSPAVVPPAMQDPALSNGLPAVGTLAVVKDIHKSADGSLIVRYVGEKRVRLHLVSERPMPEHMEETSSPHGNEMDATKKEHMILSAAVSWYQDLDPEILAVAMAPGQASAALDSIERDVHAMVGLLAKLSRKVYPEESMLPDSIFRFAPPTGASQNRLTSYDTLKAAGHRAASAIEMWRRHGSVYKTGADARYQANIQDPYAEFSERLAKSDRQEMYSFALASLIQTGIPEAGALLLSQSTKDRLLWISESCIRPYLAQLQAAAAVKNAVNDTT